ncbi:hypothetical protein BU15DRAFT_62603 [Melanogaster broomeanus]|nr:hypothetical protein BU15DRAFT_62603 [Melanogaster broomeanus]
MHLAAAKLQQRNEVTHDARQAAAPPTTHQTTPTHAPSTAMTTNGNAAKTQLRAPRQQQPAIAMVTRHTQQNITPFPLCAKYQMSASACPVSHSTTMESQRARDRQDIVPWSETVFPSSRTTFCRSVTETGKPTCATTTTSPRNTCTTLHTRVSTTSSATSTASALPSPSTRPEHARDWLAFSDHERACMHLPQRERGRAVHECDRRHPMFERARAPQQCSHALLEGDHQPGDQYLGPMDHYASWLALDDGWDCR